MNAMYQEQQTRVNNAEPGTEPRPGFSRNPKGDKSTSFQDKTDSIRQAWVSKFDSSTSKPGSSIGWIQDVLDDGVVVSQSDGLYLYPYVMSSDGNVTFGVPSKVKREYLPTKGLTISIATMRILCPDCATEMERKGFKSIQWSALKEGDVSNLAEHMKKKLGGDPNFFTKCMDADETADANDREALCARLHKEVTGIWPAEHEGKGAMLSVNYIKSLHVPDAEQFFRDVIAVKSIGKDTVKGYLALWGDPDTVDIESEFFTGAKSPIGATDFWDKTLALPRPLTWSHAQDKATKQIAQVGALVELGDDDVGRWYVAQLDLSHRYRKAIDKLISQRAIGTSSDSAPQYVIRQPVSKGATWLQQWPLFAAALTTTPCEPRQIGSVDYFKSLGIDLGELALGTEAAQHEARRAEIEKRVQSLKPKERLLKLYI
jgi:hypothetical protein